MALNNSTSTSNPLYIWDNNQTASTTTEIIDHGAYYSESLLQFIGQYRTVHGQLSLAVCVFGIIANVLNIIVLTRKNMISPTNAILTGMAASDLIVIAIYIPYIIHTFLRDSIPFEEKFTRGWAVFIWAYSIISVVFHSISIWLTVILAIWRYITVRAPTGHKSSFSMSQAIIAIVCTYLLVFTFCVPIYVCFTVTPFTMNTSNVTMYKVDMVDHPELQQINFWAFSVLLKLVPCIALTYLSLALVRILIEARKRKERLLGVGKFASRISTGSGKAVPSVQQQSVIRRGVGENEDGEATKPLNEGTEVVAGNGKIYLEIADNSPTTEYDRTSSKSSKGGESVQERSGSRLSEAVVGCCNKFCFGNLISNLLDRCFFCCGCLLCCFSLNSTFSCLEKYSSSSSNSNGGSSRFKYQAAASIHTGPPVPSHSQASASSGNSERTTRMLIAVLIVFLVCEFPSGILALLSGVLGKDFFQNVYTNFGEIMDMLALINSAVNFILYCCMSAQFRKTFSQLFCIRWTERVSSSTAGPLGDARRGGPNHLRGRGFSRPDATFATELMCTFHEEGGGWRGRTKSGDSGSSGGNGSEKSAKSASEEQQPDAAAVYIEMTTPKRADGQDGEISPIQLEQQDSPQQGISFEHT